MNLPTGFSAEIERVTVEANGVALVKKERYRRAKVNATGSFNSIET